MKRLVVATRKSALALAQARAVMRALAERHPGLEIVELHVTTTGDRVQDRALNQIGGKGLFIKEIEEAILERRADLAIHSMKDVPADLAPGLVIGCVPGREDPRDVLVSRSSEMLQALAAGSRVGTSSLRRAVALRALRPDLEIVPMRGNVDTRLRRCADGVVDAIVLARAGLARLGLLDRVTETLDPDQLIPAVGQGALALEHRAADSAVAELLAPLADTDTTIAVSAERGVLEAVQGSCQLPVAAYARRDKIAIDRLKLAAMLAEPDGSRLRRRDVDVPWPADESEARAIGRDVGNALR
jgi:hydroxymethylbilane synthase